MLWIRRRNTTQTERTTIHLTFNSMLWILDVLTEPPEDVGFAFTFNSMLWILAIYEYLEKHREKSLSTPCYGFTEHNQGNPA